jgi:O-antigen/teichoic acid export membrane protein
MLRVSALAARLRGSFLGDVLKLSFGTLVGRLIAIAILPALTRLYSPADFALLAVYLALVSIIAVAACLRLEVAIPLIESDTEAAEVFVIALIVLTLVTIVLAVIALLFPQAVAQGLRSPALAPYLWLVPVGVVMAGSYSAMQFWATRIRRFGAIARTRVGQAVTGAATMLALGWAGLAPLGLLLGNMLNIGAGSVSLAGSALAHDRATFRKVRLSNLGTALRRNRRYPIFSTPEALFNMAGVQVPVLLIAAYGGVEAGFLLLAMKVMAVPMTLLGSSISQVYVSRAPQEYREGRLAPFTLSIMRRLVLVGVGPLLLAGALAPWAFPLIFGADWARAGELVTWLVPWMALQFVASPVSMVMFVVGRQRAMLALTTLGLIMRVGGALLALQFGPVALVAGLVAGSIAYYLAVAVFVMAAAGFSARQVLSLLAAFLDWRVLAPAGLCAALWYIT